MDQAVIYALIAVGLFALGFFVLMAQAWSNRRRAIRREGPYRNLRKFAAETDTAFCALIGEWEAAPASADLVVDESIRNKIYELHATYVEGF